MTNAAISVENLSKSYGPKGLSFSVPEGVICGFLGPNGAGKTTTLRILMGFAHATGGRASVLGVPAGSTHEIFERVAFVPETKDLYPFARAGEMMRLTRGFYPQWDHELERRLVDEFEISLRQRCARLSKGLKAKLAVLLALCRKPDLLALDEPTDGLDPLGIEQVLGLLVQQTAERNATVFFSSHRLDEVEQIADHVVMISRGRAVAAGDIDDVKNRYRRVRCIVDAEPTRIPTELAQCRRDGRYLTGFSNLSADELSGRLEGTGITVLEAERASLKDIFLDRVSRS